MEHLLIETTPEKMYEHIKAVTNEFKRTGKKATILGPSAAGKSLISDAYANELAEELLKIREGTGLASLIPTHMHPTDIVPEDKVLIVIKFKNNIIDMDEHKDFFVDSLCNSGSSILKKSNTTVMNPDEMKQEFKNCLSTYFFNSIQKNDNTSFYHMVTLIKDKNTRDRIIKNLIDAFAEIPAHELIEVVRQSNTSAPKGAEDTHLRQTVTEKLDSDWKKYSLVFWANCKELVDEIKKSALENTIYDEKAGCHYIWLSKNTPNEQKQMFLSSQDKSIEFLFEKMDIYYRISNEMIEYINRNPYTKAMLTDRFGNIFFTIVDTRGLFHLNGTIEQAVRESKDYIYNGNSDLIIFCIGAVEDPLHKKALMVLKELKASIKRDVDMLVVMPHTDELALRVKGTSKPASRFKRSSDNTTADDNTVIEKIKQFKGNIKTSLEQIRVDGKRHIKVRDVIMYGLYGHESVNSIIEEFDPQKAFQSILNELSLAAWNSSQKIHVKLNKEVDDIKFDWNDKTIDQKITTSILNSPLFKTSVYIPVITNIQNNKDKIAHGNSARSTVDNSQWGYGHNGAIDMDWFVNVESINIQFPQMLWAITTNVITKDILDEIKITYGGFVSDEDEKLFEKLLNSVFSQSGNGSILHAGRKLAAKLFYYNHIKPLKDQGFFCYSYLLRDSLNSCFFSYIKWNTGNVNEIVVAYKEVVKEACDIIKDKYMVFNGI